MYHYYWQIGQNRFEVKTHKSQLIILGVWVLLLFVAPATYLYTQQLANPDQTQTEQSEEVGEVAGASTSPQIQLVSIDNKAANIALFIGIVTFLISATALYILIIELDKDKRLNPMLERWRKLQPERY